MIDSHCHLTAKEFSSDISEVINRALTQGVTHCICIVDSLEEFPSALQITTLYEHIFCTIGVHPHKASTWDQESRAYIMAACAQHVAIKAIGEIGLDYHYNFSPRETQIQVFKQQLQIAKELNLPVVVHCRDAWDDLWHCMEESTIQNAVLHCCTEPYEHVRKWLQKGWLVSFTGIATFPKATVIHDVIKKIPSNSFMIETDAPYLAPIPQRDQRNEPSFLSFTAQYIAELRQVELQNLITETVATTKQFFAIE